MKSKIKTTLTVTLTAIVLLATTSAQAQERDPSSALTQETSVAGKHDSLALRLRTILKDFEDDAVQNEVDRNKLLAEVAKINAKLGNQIRLPQKQTKPKAAAPENYTPVPTPGFEREANEGPIAEPQQSPSGLPQPSFQNEVFEEPAAIVGDLPTSPEDPAEAKGTEVVAKRLLQIEVELRLINRKLDWLHSRSKQPMTAQVE